MGKFISFPQLLSRVSCVVVNVLLFDYLLRCSPLGYPLTNLSISIFCTSFEFTFAYFIIMYTEVQIPTR